MKAAGTPKCVSFYMLQVISLKYGRIKIFLLIENDSSSSFRVVTKFVNDLAEANMELSGLSEALGSLSMFEKATK